MRIYDKVYIYKRKYISKKRKSPDFSNNKVRGDKYDIFLTQKILINVYYLRGGTYLKAMLQKSQ